MCEWKGDCINKYLHAVTDQKTLPCFVLDGCHILGVLLNNSKECKEKLLFFLVLLAFTLARLLFMSLKLSAGNIQQIFNTIRRKTAFLCDCRHRNHYQPMKVLDDCTRLHCTKSQFWCMMPHGFNYQILMEKTGFVTIWKSILNF